MFIIKNVLYFIISQLILLSSLMISNIYVRFLTFVVNIFITWIIIKNVEKKYYKKYDRLSSMLYNLCPLLGVILVFGLVYYFNPLDFIRYLLKYYGLLYSFSYMVNAIYVLIKTLKYE